MDLARASRRTARMKGSVYENGRNKEEPARQPGKIEQILKVGYSPFCAACDCFCLGTPPEAGISVYTRSSLISGNNTLPPPQALVASWEGHDLARACGIL